MAMIVGCARAADVVLGERRSPSDKPRLKSRRSFLTLLGITLFEIRVPFEHADQLKFLIFPFLIWSAYRFGQRLTSLAVVFVSVVAILGLLHSSGANDFRHAKTNGC